MYLDSNFSVPSGPTNSSSNSHPANDINSGSVVGEKAKSSPLIFPTSSIAGSEGNERQSSSRSSSRPFANANRARNALVTSSELGEETARARAGEDEMDVEREMGGGDDSMGIEGQSFSMLVDDEESQMEMR